MKPREKFAIGERVQFVRDAGFPQYKDARGEVVGYGHSPSTIRVRIDGRSQISTWGIVFWEPCGSEAAVPSEAQLADLIGQHRVPLTVNDLREMIDSGCWPREQVLAVARAAAAVGRER
jgi:hypothetical protein